MSIPAFKSSAEEALAVIVKGQRASGLWGGNYRQADGEDDVEASIWQFIALTSGSKTSAKVEGLHQSLGKATQAMEDILKTNPDPGTTAGAVLCLQLSRKRRSPDFEIALRRLEAVNPEWDSPSFIDPLFRWYLVKQVMFHKGGRSWVSWNGQINPLLIKNQTIIEESERLPVGFWDSPGKGERYGRVYSTALCILSFEIYYRYLPVFQRDPALGDLTTTNDIVVRF